MATAATPATKQSSRSNRHSRPSATTAMSTFTPPPEPPERVISAISARSPPPPLGPPPEKGESLGVSPSDDWRVDDASVRPLPMFYPVEATSRFVPGVKAGEIASEITDRCRAMGVLEYDDGAATAVLRTVENVEMNVTLWKGTDSRCPDGIIVEVQRRRGDAISFYRYCRKILDAASEGRERTHSKIAGKMLDEEKPSWGGTELENSLLALDIFDSLIKKDRMDARLLGMESLILLTDPNRTGLGTAMMASRVVLTGAQHRLAEGEYLPEEEGIGDAILSMDCSGHLSGDGGLDSDEEISNVHQESEYDLLRSLALTVMANSLEVMENTGWGNRGHPTRLRGSIPVSIKPIVGEKFQLFVSPSGTLREVKERIACRVHIHPNQQHLCFGRRELGDSAIVASCGIVDGSVLHLVPRLRGGAHPGPVADAPPPPPASDAPPLQLPGDFHSLLFKRLEVRVTSSSLVAGAEQLGSCVSAILLGPYGAVPAVVSVAGEADGDIRNLGRHGSCGSAATCGVHLSDRTLAALNLEITAERRRKVFAADAYTLSARGDFFLVRGSNTEAEASLRGIMRRPQGVVLQVLEGWLKPGTPRA